MPKSFRWRKAARAGKHHKEGTTRLDLFFRPRSEITEQENFDHQQRYRPQAECEEKSGAYKPEQWPPRERRPSERSPVTEHIDDGLDDSDRRSQSSHRGLMRPTRCRTRASGSLASFRNTGAAHH